MRFDKLTTAVSPGGSVTGASHEATASARATPSTRDVVTLTGNGMTIGTPKEWERASPSDHSVSAPRIVDRMNVQLNRANDFLARLSSLPPGLPVP
jgi:hypothetical protein